MKKKYWQLLFATTFVFGCAWAVKQHAQTVYRQDSGNVFGTVYHIIYQSDRDLKDSILTELGKVDNSLSMFNPNSVISRINRNEPVVPDSMFKTVFCLAEQVSTNTGGAFDITVSPLVNLWGFGFKKKDSVTKEKVDSLMPLVGYRKVALKDGHIVKSDPRMMLDCSAIAKGFGSDCVARLLDRHGISNYMVEIGGEIVIKGKNQEGENWRIGVVKPTDNRSSDGEEISAILDLSNIGMATSGNYRNFYYKGGKKYAHTIDPHTGYPVQHSILSSTVIAKDCATADAYATSFMVLGLQKAKKVLKRHPELEAYFIYSDKNGKNAVWCSPRLQSKIQK